MAEGEWGGSGGRPVARPPPPGADLPPSHAAGGDAQQQAVLKPSWLVSSPQAQSCSALHACQVLQHHPANAGRRWSGRQMLRAVCQPRRRRRRPSCAAQLAAASPWLLRYCPSAALSHPCPCHSCLRQDGGRSTAAGGGGGAAGPWRSAAHRAEQPKPAAPASRFDTSIGGRNWRDDEREGGARRDAGRWGDGEHGGGGRQFAEPHNPAGNDAPRGRGRGGADVARGPPRGGGGEPDGWRAGGGGDAQGGGGWRANDRWGGGGGGGAGAWRWLVWMWQAGWQAGNGGFRPGQERMLWRVGC